MLIRETHLNDINELQYIRNAVTENRLSDPSVVPDGDYPLFLKEKGKGWVCEINGRIVGFAIVDLKGRNIWALFVLPGYERLGVGRSLQETMLSWYFQRTREMVWLSTSPGTRAEKFYTKTGWKVAGKLKNGEIRFEMTYEQWIRREA
jgi:GNAT superfamily N-acetyltransferase